MMSAGRYDHRIRIVKDVQTTDKDGFPTSSREVILEPYAREYVSAQIKKIGHRIGREISAHTLRHSFATRKVQQLPGKLDAVSRYLGHSSPSITLAMYCHNTMTDAELYEDLATAI